MLVGNQEALFSDSESFIFIFIVIRVEIENRGRKANVSCYCLGWEVARGAQGAFPGPIWDGGKGWEKAVHMPSCVTYVTKKHFMFVKRTLTYLAVNII